MLSVTINQNKHDYGNDYIANSASRRIPKFCGFLVIWAIRFTVWTRPKSLWRFFEIRIEADQMIGSRTSITENYFSSLLANITIVFMFLLEMKII
jgi:hypothetical protein